ncbi:TetR/AcrR family transcriptional regulator [Nonomuraea sp. NPDC000554]|uniref:TetR/AcrR family transcriptional regulator n=1 Tax=Nonomuraea sp. NPDC000554 TaxID=3154259 RepID=UPI00332EDF78
MARPAKFDADQILDAAAAVAAESGQGAVTVTAVAARLGAPSGSIYHRYGSRDLLLAHLWIRTVRRFQEGFLHAAETGNLAEAVRRAAAHTVRWSAEHPDEARLLLRYHVEDLRLAWPQELGEELSRLNTASVEAMRRLAERSGHGDLERVVFALVDIPLAAVRRHLSRGGAIPERAARMAEAAALAVVLESDL